MKFSKTILSLLLLSTASSGAEVLKSNTTETRTTLAFKVSDAAVRKLLPAGWEFNPSTTGPAKGSNLQIVLINQTVVTDAAGTAQPARTFAVWAAPGKKTGTETSGNLVLGGFITREDAPGDYGNFTPAQVALVRKETVSADGQTGIEETWRVKASDGSTLDIAVSFTRGVPVRSKVEATVYSAAKLGYYRIYYVEQAADVVRSVATEANRISKYSFSAKGPILASLFDGSQQLLALTSVPHYLRSIYLPGP